MKADDYFGFYELFILYMRVFHAGLKRFMQRETKKGIGQIVFLV
jgi:hypothetical protein